MVRKGIATTLLKMKLTKFSKGVFTLMFAGIFFIPTKADAKMFGQECETVTTGGGDSCIITKTVCKQRFFWINVGTTTELSGIDCSGQM